LLLLTSHADESVPHVLVEPLYARMKGQGQPVELFTVDKSPHGFYWGREEGARGVRGGRTAKTDEQEKEERRASEKIVSFLKVNLK
jgi:dienelactone hydrolase